MSKFQKIIFGSFVVLSLFLLYWGYTALKNNKQPSVKAVTLLPDGCDLMMEFENYADFSNSLRHKNLLWQELKDLNYLNEFEKHLNYFDSLLLSDDLLNELTQNNKIYFCVYPGNKFLLTCNIKELAVQKEYADLLQKKANSLALLGLTSVIEDGVIGISDSDEILKQLFVRTKTGLAENKNFQLLNNSAKYSGTSIYIHNGKNAYLLGNSYAEISLKPDRIILNGIKQTDSSGFFGDQNAVAETNMSFLNNIPLICNGFEAFAIKNAGTVFETKTKDDWWETANANAMFNAKKQFYDNITGSIVKVLMPSKSNAVIISFEDSLLMDEILPYINDSLKPKNERISKLIKYPGSFMHSTFSSLNSGEVNYFVKFADHLVFTATESDAEIFINAGDNHSSMMENKRFRQFASRNFDAEFHYLNYRLISSLNKEEIPFYDLLKENGVEKFKNISHCSYMATYKNNFLNYRFNMSFSQENFSDEPGVLWTLNADTTIITKPFLFKNHITNGNEIVYQTSNNNLYLQNATGKIVWKAKINEAIRSDIFTIDAFKNHKYQLLFSTDNYLHLIDRNGNYVQGYPVKLPAKATNKLCVFDYENKNELRLFIACSDNRIYNYSIWGIRQEGFKPLVTAAEVILPVKYCKVGLSDYLVTADRKGHIYAFSRKGDGRIDFKNKLIEDAEDFDVEAGNLLSNTQIVYFDNKGHLVEKISLEDKKEIYKTTENEGKPVYCFNDFDKNSIVDVIIAYPDKLEVYDLNGSKIFGKSLPDNISTNVVDFYNVSNSSFISIYDNVNTSVIINDVEQKTAKEFKSTQPAVICDLFNDGKSYLLVVMNGQLKCLKL